MPSHLLPRTAGLPSLHARLATRFALWFMLAIAVAASAFSSGAHAQIVLKSGAAGAVVQTPRVRAELVAQAPDGIAAGQ